MKTDVFSSPHGTFQICVHENLIKATLIGSFNKTGSTAYTETMKEVISEFEQQGILILIDDSLVEGGTPEAYEILENFNHWLNSKNVIAKAFIIKNESLKEIVLARAPSISQQNIKFFELESEAMAWLDSYKTF